MAMRRHMRPAAKAWRVWRGRGLPHPVPADRKSGPRGTPFPLMTVAPPTTSLFRAAHGSWLPE